MRVRGNADPGTAPRIEHDIGRLDYIAVRFAENVINLEFEGEENLWEYDEYLISALEVNRADIEANPAKWLAIAREWEAKRDAEREAAQREAALAQDMPLISSIAFVALAQQELIDDATIAEHPDIFDVWQPDTAYKRGKIVRYAGELYRVMQDLTSIASQPPNGPGLLAIYTPVQQPAPDGAVLPWVYGEAIALGDRRTDEGIIYECISPGGAGANIYQPKLVPSVWRAVE